MTDLIDRDAAIAAMAPMLRDMISRGKACDIIRALPAAQVAVKPLEWKMHNGFLVAETLGGEFWVEKGLDTSHAEAKHAARIREALTITPAPDAAKVQALVEALESIDIYLSDTLSGRTTPDPETYKEWLIEGIREARNRARAALAAMKEG